MDSDHHAPQSHVADLSLRSQVSAAGQILIAALLYSLAPLTIHYTATESNPLVFNSISRAIQCLVLVAYLYASKAMAFGENSTVRGIIRSTVAKITLDNHQPDKASSAKLIVNIMKIRDRAAGERSSILPRLLNPFSLLPWVGLPMLWAIVSRSDYALYAWSTHYVEVPISATIFELWPLMMVIFVATFSSSGDRSRRKHSISLQHLVYMVAGFIGLALLILGQSDVSRDSFQDFLTHGIVGVVLALAAAMFAGIAPATGIILGSLLQDAYARSHTSEKDNCQEIPDRKSSRTDNDMLMRRQRLWFALWTAMFAYAITAPVNLILALTGAAGPINATLRSAIGAIFLGGAVLAISGVLLHRTNTQTKRLGANAVFYMTPVFSLVLLAAIAGISLPRPDLFWIGAGLVLALNVIIQASPDEEPEYLRYGTRAPRGVRLGFASLILAIWSFSAAIYLRDEILPSSWLSWRAADFWTLVSLSATIFALIFGFRVARLSNRLMTEDNMMLDVFRKCENLVAEGVLDPAVLDELREFDISGQDNLPLRYDNILNHLDDTERLLRVQRSWRLTDTGWSRSGPESEKGLNGILYVKHELDKLAHSKQQGKDVSELISICIFAVMTIALGLVTRPIALGSPGAEWTGFLTELFAALFVSIIAFLAFNLFDMRRDRLVPLIARDPEVNKGFRLFFRHRKDLLGPQRISVAITFLMIMLFSVLLYHKWI